MISIDEEFIYNIINENIDLIVSDDIVSSYENIKKVTIGLSVYFQEQYEIISGLVPISENEFLKALGSYFTDFESSQIGRLLTFLMSGADIAIGSVMSSTAGLSSFITTSFGGGTVGSLAAGLGPLLLLVLIFGFYRYIKTRDVYNVNIMIKQINKIANILRYKIPEKMNTEFKNLVKNRCISIQDKKYRLECAVSGYVKYLNSYVLVDLTRLYIKYLKDNNENLSEIQSFNQLARFTSSTNKQLSSHFTKFYFAYLQFLEKLSIDKSLIGDSFNLLNKTTLSELRK